MNGNFELESPATFTRNMHAIQKIAEKWTAALQNWALTISQLDVYFEGRLQLGSMFNR